MRKILLLILIVTVGVALAACNSVKYNSNNSVAQNETSNPLTEIKATSSSQVIEPKTQNATSESKVLPNTESTTIIYDDFVMPIEGTKADSFYIEETIEFYVENLASAINDNDFSQINDHLMPGSKIYQSQEKFVAEQFSKGIKYKLRDFNIEEIEPSSKKGEYKAYVTEHIEISELNKAKETKKIKHIYTVINDDKIRAITDIQEWNGK